MLCYNYLRVYENYFWLVEDDGDDITGQGDYEDFFVIASGPTIGHIDEVIGVLKTLAPVGLPPFGTLLQVIAALRTNAEESIMHLENWGKQFIDRPPLLGDPSVNLAKAMNFLKTLNSLAQEYKEGAKRDLLLRTIFQNAHNSYSISKSKRVLREIAQEHTINKEVVYNAEHLPFSTSNFIKDYRGLQLLNRKFPTTDDILRAMEGLPPLEREEDDLVEELVANETLVEEEKSFVEKLAENPMTYLMGSLVKRIWSGLRIPFHQNIPSGQPFGGMADLTNKGNFDRILISEYANDDMLFLSRLLNNEVLYYEREIPPQLDEKMRVMLIDNSIRSWGNPKLMSYALGIAIGNHPNNSQECTYYSVGDNYKSLQMETVHQVIQSQFDLSGSIDALKGLKSYFESSGFVDSNEHIFITSEESYRTADVQLFIQQHRNHFKFILTSDQEGFINLYTFKKGVIKHAQKFHLPLQELWDEEKAAIPRLEQKRSKKKQRNKKNKFPILLPLSKFYEHIFLSNDAFYNQVNGAVYHYTHGMQKGVDLIFENSSLKDGLTTLIRNTHGVDVVGSYHVDAGVFLFYNTASKRITTKEIALVGLIEHKLKLINIHNQFVFTDGENFLVYDEKGNKCKPDLNSLRSLIEEYDTRISEFINQFRNDRQSNFSVIKRLEALEYIHNSMELNSCIFGQGKFYPRKHDRHHPNSKVIYPKVNLFLKRITQESERFYAAIFERIGLTRKEVELKMEEYGGMLAGGLSQTDGQEAKEYIESKGAVCFLKNSYIQLPDSSRISIDQGILIFESAKKSIPKFYIPFILNKPSCMSTKHEFAGNTFFLPENSGLTQIPITSFQEKYINPFFQHIANYETAD